MKQYYAIQQGDNKADVYIFGDIVPFEYSESDVSAYGLSRQLEAIEANEINVYIDSYGGAVSEGWAIYNVLRKHPAKIITHGEGFVASAALFPFMAGDERHASALSAYYFHEVMVGAIGYADELLAAANEADLLTEIGLAAFVERSNLTAEQVREFMKAETWLTPAQALEYGLATAITAEASPRHTQGAKKYIIQSFLQSKQVKESEPEAENADPALIMPEQNKILRLFERR